MIREGDICLTKDCRNIIAEPEYGDDYEVYYDYCDRCLDDQAKRYKEREEWQFYHNG